MPKILGIVDWDLTRDKDFHRDYHITILVQLELPVIGGVLTGSSLEGPFTAASTPGLPVYGDLWNFQTDVDVWAYCKAQVTCKPYPHAVPNQYFAITYLFSTKPDYRCNETSIEDPLLEPPKLSGGFTKYTLEDSIDRFGNIIQSSSFELFKGPVIQWDNNRSTVKIDYPTPTLNLALYTAMMDTVNEFELWGQQPRCVKLSNASWQQVFFGSCYVYYRWSLEFDVDPNTFDRDIPDFGIKCLHGENHQGTWVITNLVNPSTGVGFPPNPKNPLHFVEYEDINGNHPGTPLNGRGVPVAPVGSGEVDASLFISSSDPPILLTTTIPVVTPPGTSGFPSSGTITITDITSDGTAVTIVVSYTGITPSSLTGCTLISFSPMSALPAFGDYQTTNGDGFSIDGGPGNIQAKIHFEKYNESDFSQLGIPLVLDPYSGL